MIMSGMRLTLLIMLILLCSLQQDAIAQAPGWSWGKQAGKGTSDWGTGVSVDAHGNLYAVGSYYGTPQHIFGDTITSGLYGGYIARFTSAGDTIWSNPVNGIEFTGVTTDAAGYAYATGTTFG